MKKFFFTVLIALLFVIVTAFSFRKKEEKSSYIQQDNATFTVSQLKLDDSHYIPGYGKTFLGFKEAIGFKESRGKYHVVNTLGYVGKYQFGKSALATYRIYDVDHFIKNSELQEKVFKAHCSYNKYLLRNEIDQFAGTTIKGIEITESGILAAAHLAGSGGVRRYLRSNGKGRRIVDAYGTNIEQYLVKFADYDLSFIEATKYPTL